MSLYHQRIDLLNKEKKESGVVQIKCIFTPEIYKIIEDLNFN